MAISVTNSGSLTMSASEQTLGAARTDGKTYVLQVDLNNMAAGDVAEIRCYIKTLSTSTERLLFKQAFADSQSGSPNYQSIPVAAPYSVKFVAIQPTGTGRSIDYALFSID